MSYILDALRKSESERRQGRVPDLGQQVQLIHKPKKRSSMVLVWVGVGLMLNAAVLIYIFRPSAFVPAIEPKAAENPAPSTAPEPEPVTEPKTEVDATGNAQTNESEEALSEPAQQVERPEVASSAEEQEKPTIIVPSRRRSEPASDEVQAQPSSASSVPHLVEMPLPFQKSVPDLVFNSHIYASEPSSRRVMINNQYLRAGDSFSGIRVDQITEQGVVLSKNGRQFRVGSVRDWVSPE
ncbi:general secretion pathway protein GspB [Marinobacter sp. CHS3-4]|uniref:general secretion pathway protein GspB n=1 Tax=Marinobacter sp. CHS3-4 TaxID=3045174 RepID=UPI0024B4F99B|nr:general secretion pathway protein GspB [Marinobacter sp. CHS3-4]MDI9245528.1 general secretion pathway protein GspB [Marinobacter sp. CHS3-4]